jgi:hypothetical protein
VFQQIVPLAPIVFFQYGTASGYYLGTTEQIVLPASGSFQTTLTGLSPNMTYFARAGMLLPLITAIAPPDVHEYFIAGAGVGFNNTALLRKVAVVVGNPEPIYGNEISFTTACGTTGGGNTNVSVSNPVSLPTITVLNATLAAGKAAPGEKVGITATLANKGNSNGTSKVTLYVNGQEVESQGVVLASGEKRTVNFTLSRNEPGTYSVYVNSVRPGILLLTYLLITMC